MSRLDNGQSLRELLMLAFLTWGALCEGTANASAVSSARDWGELSSTNAHAAASEGRQLPADQNSPAGAPGLPSDADRDPAVLSSQY
jgi:hypothetical protein